MTAECNGRQRLQLSKSGVEFVDGDRSSKYPKQSEFQTIGIPFLNTTSTSEFRLDLSQVNFIKLEKYNQITKGRSQRNDLLLTTRGSNTGKVALFNCEHDTALINAQMLILRVNPNRICPAFLFYQFRTVSFQRTLKAYSSGSAQPQLPIKSLKDIHIILPPIGEQRAIARVLGTLDDKIELNRRMNETLEAMARALFKSWFVDFDPVRAKAEGRDPGLPKHIADLFPDSFEDSELGEIPKGWEAKRFADTVDIIGGGTPKTSVAEYWDGDIPWFSVVDAPRDSDVWVVETTKKITRKGIENSSTRVLSIGTTIISARGTVGRIALVGVPMAMNQSCYGLRGKTGTRGFFTYYVTRELVARLQQHAHGSVFDTITQDTLAGVSLASPKAALIEAFEIYVGSALERIRASLLSSRTLAALRDTLLPKLISGELRVLDTERIAENV